MSGECKSYRLNEPMKLQEFKAMPKDLQIAYIKLIREKWNPPVVAIAKMMGCDRPNLSKYLLSLGFEKQPRGAHPWDKMGFAEWCYGTPKQENQSLQEILQEAHSEDVEMYETVEEEIPVEVEQEVVEEETAVHEEVSPFVEIPNRGIKINLIREESAPAFAIPASGNMTYEGDALDILRSISRLLGGAKVQLDVSWNVVED